MRIWGGLYSRNRFKILFPALCVLLLSRPCVRADTGAPGDIQHEIGVSDDLRTVQVCREGLAGIVQFMRSRPDLFPEHALKEKRMLSSGQKALVRSTWQSFLDYCLVLDELSRQHKKFYTVTPKQLQRDSFLVLYTAFLAQYRYALEFLIRSESDPSFDIVFNEPDPDLGLPGTTYAAFKYRFLNVIIATEFAALTALYDQYAPGFSVPVPDSITRDREYIWAMGKGRGAPLTAKNALNIIQGAGFAAWLPVQQGVSELMGDTRVWRKDVSLIGREQIEAMLPLLEPGDIIFERREWYLSNIGLPGFWTHVALYVGTPAERSLFFDNDAEVCELLNSQGVNSCGFENFLRAQHPGAYAVSLAAQEENLPPRILEATGEGVSFTTLEHSASCDSLAVLRPRLSKKEKAYAIGRAFGYQGRPYDFNFDFLTDASLVCSELVYKSYEPAPRLKGLHLPLVDMLGRKLTPPNEIVRQFDQNFGTDQQQVDLVLFYDGIESEKQARASSLEEFRKSWRRPKWHLFVQKTAAVDIFGEEKGIWEISAPAGCARWIIIHNLSEARQSGIFHIEVLEKQTGRPDSDFRRVCSHMAVTREVLERSVIRARETGAVYPESFNDAYAAWKRNVTHGESDVCSSSITGCLDQAGGD